MSSVSDEISLNWETYSWLTPKGPFDHSSRLKLPLLAQQRLAAALKSELSSKGFVFTEDQNAADFLVECCSETKAFVKIIGGATTANQTVNKRLSHPVQMGAEKGSVKGRLEVRLYSQENRSVVLSIYGAKRLLPIEVESNAIDAEETMNVFLKGIPDLPSKQS